MDAHHTWFTLCLLLLCAGCRSANPDPSVQLLERELMWMEDQLYMMEDQLHDACTKLNAYQAKPYTRENERPSLFQRRNEPTPATRDTLSEKDLPSDDDESMLDDIIIRSPGGGDGDDSFEDLPRKVTPPNPPVFGDDVEADELQPPSIELPSLNDSPAATTPPSLDPPTREPELDQNLPNPFPIEPQVYLEAAAASTDKTVTHVAVTTRRIAASHPDESEVVRVVIQPRNASGQFVANAAPVSVLITRDGADSDPVSADPVAAWEFDVIEANRSMQRTSESTGIHLDLPWPEATPMTDDMIIQVKYTTVDGRTLDATQPLHGKSLAPIAIAAADDQTKSTASSVGGWTPANRSDNRQIVPASVSSVFDGQPNQLPNNLHDRSSETPSRSSIKTRPIDASWIDGSSGELSAKQDSVQMPATGGVLERPTWQPYR